MDGRKKNGGQIGNKGGGRRPIALEHNIRKLASPFIPDAIRIVSKIMKTGEKEADRLTAAKLLLAYYFGQPKQQTDITSNGNTIKNPSITVLSAEASETIKQMYSERPDQ